MKNCGFGCQMHHLMYCFITAYATNRTLIVDSNVWSYNSRGLDAYFKPLSDSCTSYKEPVTYWDIDLNVEKSDASVILIPEFYNFQNEPKFLPLSLPKKYFDKISLFHGDPFVWWSSHISAYLMRFNDEFLNEISKKKDILNFSLPCVG